MYRVLIKKKLNWKINQNTTFFYRGGEYLSREFDELLIIQEEDIGFFFTGSYSTHPFRNKNFSLVEIMMVTIL